MTDPIISSGPVVTFNSSRARIPIDSIICDIDPVQAGSGDPSPSNVRAISGWTGAKIKRTGKNLLDISAFATEYPSYCSYNNGVLSVTTNTVLYTTGIAVDIPAGTILSFVLTLGTATNVRIRLVYDDGTTTDVTTQTGYSIEKRVVSVRLNWSSQGTFTLEKVQIEFGLTATSYEPYTGSTYPISFGAAGTVYGGRLNVTTGELTVTHTLTNLGLRTWSYDNTYGVFFVTDVRYGDLPKWICTHYPYKGMYNVMPDKSCGYIYTDRICIRDSAYSDAATFKTAMNNVYGVIPLKDTITYQLTPTEVTTLLGENNIWADTGDIEVVFDGTTVIDTLIFDRTQADVDRVKELKSRILNNGWTSLTQEERAEYLAGMKGAYNAVDLNRIGRAINFIVLNMESVAAALEAYRQARGVADDSQFNIPIAPAVSEIDAKTDWAIPDIPQYTQTDKIISDINTLQMSVPLPPGSPELPLNMDKMDYLIANDIEHLLFVIDQTLNGQEDEIEGRIDRAADAFIYSAETNCGG